MIRTEPTSPPRPGGQGVRQDSAEAVRWYRKAAERGYIVAQNNLGVAYSEGQGVRQDYPEALRWYRKAAEQGFAAAQHNLGEMYYEGKGVHQNYTEALRWYLKAAEQGFSPAQNRLGEKIQLLHTRIRHSNHSQIFAMCEHQYKNKVKALDFPGDN